MSEMKRIYEILVEAEELAQRLSEDIPLCRTRDEHIRVTARANEARNLAYTLSDTLSRIFTTEVPDEDAAN